MSTDTVIKLLYSLTSWSFKSASKDDLIGGSAISAQDGGEAESAHGEVGDSVVDCLLL